MATATGVTDWMKKETDNAKLRFYRQATCRKEGNKGKYKQTNGKETFNTGRPSCCTSCLLTV